MLHGAAAAARAAETARRTFEEGASAEGLPTIGLDLAKGTGLLAACVAAGFASSNGEARRHIQGGAIRINDVQVSNNQHGAQQLASQRRRRHQAVDRQEEARAGEARLTGVTG